MKLVIGGKEYPLGDMARVTLGEQRQIKRIIGKPLSAMVTTGPDGNATVDPTDPDVFVAIVWLAMHRNDKTVTVEQIEELSIDEIEVVTEPEDEPAEGGDADPPAPSGSVASENGSGAPDKQSLEPGGEPAGSETSDGPETNATGTGPEASGSVTSPAGSGSLLSNSSIRP